MPSINLRFIYGILKILLLRPKINKINNLINLKLTSIKQTIRYKTFSEIVIRAAPFSSVDMIIQSTINVARKTLYRVAQIAVSRKPSCTIIIRLLHNLSVVNIAYFLDEVLQKNNCCRINNIYRCSRSSLCIHYFNFNDVIIIKLISCGKCI